MDGLEQLVLRIRLCVRDLIREGTTGMGIDNLKMVVDTNNLVMSPAEFHDRFKSAAESAVTSLDFELLGD